MREPRDSNPVTNADCWGKISIFCAKMNAFAYNLVVGSSVAKSISATRTPSLSPLTPANAFKTELFPAFVYPTFATQKRSQISGVMKAFFLNPT